MPVRSADIVETLILIRKRILNQNIYMGMKLVNILAILVLSSLASTTTSGVFDVTSSIYGGKPHSDISQGLANAWRDACASESASKVVVPSGTYKLKQATFEGPCKAPVEVQIQGTLQAPKDRSSDTWVAFRSIDMLIVSGGGTFDGQRTHGSKDGDIKDIRFSSVTNSIIKDITSLDSKKFHIGVSDCTNVVFHHLTITSAADSANTDGINIASSTRINVTHTNIATGDDCISVGEGTNQLLVTNVTCGPGHGLSIGSLGYYPDEKPVVGVTIMNCTLTGTTNGVRIKTWPNSPGPSTASDILFEDIVMVNVENPIIIDQNYCSGDEDRCKHQTPSEVLISNVKFKNIRGSSATLVGVNLACSSTVPCQDVELDDIDLTYDGHEGSLTSQCFNVRARITRVAKTLACANLPGLPSNNSPPPPPLYDYNSPMIYSGAPDCNSCWWPRQSVMVHLLISGLGLWLLKGTP